MKVLKFGGTSVGSPQRMLSVTELINNNEPKIVVLSAMSGTTNKLVEISQTIKTKNKEKSKELIASLYSIYKQVVSELCHSEINSAKANKYIEQTCSLLSQLSQSEFTEREEKIVLAQGELLSTNLFKILLDELNIESVLLPALDFMYIDKDEEPDLNKITALLTAKLREFPNSKLFITQGYICRNTANEIDNLKRGGSDYSASLIGAAIQATEIQIWTDIDGMHNNDPRIVENTTPIAELSFDEAAELAYFGAKILHPSSVFPAMQKNIPVRLLNTMEPLAKGTLITSNQNSGSIKAIAAKDGITAIKIKSSRMLLAYGFLRSVFEIFERYKTPIDMITTSEVAISLTIDNLKNLDKIIEELKTFGTVEVETEQTIVCVVGDFIADKSGTALKVFEALKDIPVRMISYGGSRHNLSLLINSDYKNNALNVLHKNLFEVKHSVA